MWKTSSEKFISLRKFSFLTVRLFSAIWSPVTDWIVLVGLFCCCGLWTQALWGDQQSKDTASYQKEGSPDTILPKDIHKRLSLGLLAAAEKQLLGYRGTGAGRTIASNFTALSAFASWPSTHPCSFLTPYQLFSWPSILLMQNSR